MTGDPYSDTMTGSPATDELTSALAASRRVPHRPVDASIARSWLLVPGTRADTFDAAAASRADAVVLDIEDAVDPSN